MFQKILIANRGEIACRVIATSRRLGIRTVAVYSDADANAKHVHMADEAYRIGPAPVAESYLLAQNIIKVAKASGAQAIHPGYGFLSENPDFVEAVESAGIVFIGPGSAAISAMGLKDAAKDLMSQAGVPVVPGYHGDNQDPKFLAEQAEKIGYPVLIKARAGGGGKGMRLVTEANTFQESLQSAQREATASFGDGVCLIEKYVTEPRHIEMQIFGDIHGNVVHFFERDCSLQRRHQKVIEEAPAPNMPEGVRSAMGKAAIDAAKAIGYAGAGTVEFIVDGSDGLKEDAFWFMEMNTRLQVEHPVSEAISGFDFVELQLRIAAGESLPIQQSDLKINGWSFEARLYAEDVPGGFLPATGQLERLRFPEGVEFTTGPLRIDSGVQEGDAVTPYYDPMIAKIIVHGADRRAALNALGVALDNCQIDGLVTNLDFLGALTRHREFAKGQVDTDLIARDIRLLTQEAAPSDLAIGIAAIVSLGLLQEYDTQEPWNSLVGWQQWGETRYRTKLHRNDETIAVEVAQVAPNDFRAQFDGRGVGFTARRHGANSAVVFGADRRFSLEFHQTAGRIALFLDGRTFHFETPADNYDSDDSGESSDRVIAPMPGAIASLSVSAGDSVSIDDRLIVIEAMKMEHALVAARDGVVADVLVAEGDQVEVGDVLISLKSCTVTPGNA